VHKKLTNLTIADYGFLYRDNARLMIVTDLVFVVDAVERVEMRISGRPTDTATVGLQVILTVPSSVGADTVHTAENLMRVSFNTKN